MPGLLVPVEHDGAPLAELAGGRGVVRAPAHRETIAGVGHEGELDGAVRLAVLGALGLELLRSVQARAVAPRLRLLLLLRAPPQHHPRRFVVSVVQRCDANRAVVLEEGRMIWSVCVPSGASSPSVQVHTGGGKAPAF